MKLYLDLCALKRPFDDVTSDRIQLEALAVLFLLQATFDGRIRAISSAFLELENSRSPDWTRRLATEEILARLSRGGVPSAATAPRAAELGTMGLKPLERLAHGERGAPRMRPVRHVR
jgi:hypothetical protein